MHGLVELKTRTHGLSSSPFPAEGGSRLRILGLLLGPQVPALP